MAMFETLVQLFAAFAKIGFTSFGGTSMIPLIMDEMSSHGWMTDADLTNLIAIAEMTPGSLGVNAATFAGTKTAGMPGGVFAAIGLCIPAVVTLTIVTAIYDAIKDNYWVWSALKGVQCAVAPIIGGAAISLGKDALTSAMPIIICAVAFVLCYFTSISNLTLVVAGVVIALVWMGVSEHGHV